MRQILYKMLKMMIVRVVFHTHTQELPHTGAVCKKDLLVALCGMFIDLRVHGIFDLQEGGTQ